MFFIIVDGGVPSMHSRSAFLGVKHGFASSSGVTEAVTSCSLRQKDTTYRTISFLSAQTVVGVLLGYGGSRSMEGWWKRLLMY